MQTKKYWVVGGIVTSVFNFIFLIIGSTFGLVHDFSDSYGELAGNIFEFFRNIFLYSFLNNEGFQLVESIIISMIFTFILGSLVGFIFQKLNRKI